MDVYFAPTLFSAAKHREFGFNREMEILPLFLPESPLLPAASPRKRGTLESRATQKPYFLFSGRLEVIKGLQDVIPLFGADMAAELWIAGQGSYEPALRKLARGLSNVRFLGQQPAEGMRELYVNARAVIAPSRCYEVFPMILLEAFREGTPVIARRLGPYPEIVEANGAGLMFGSKESLRTAIERLIHEPGLRGRLGRAGQDALRRKWSERIVVARFLERIARVADSRGETETAERTRQAAAR